MMLVFNAIFSLASSFYVLLNSRNIFSYIFISFSSYWIMLLASRNSEYSTVIECLVIFVNLFVFLFILNKQRITWDVGLFFVFILYCFVCSLIRSDFDGMLLSFLGLGPVLYVMVKKNEYSTELIAIIVVFVGLYLRFFNSVVYDISFLQARYDSSVWGVNSLGAIVLLISPFIKWRVTFWILVISVLLSLSRGLIVLFLFEEILLMFLGIRSNMIKRTYFFIFSMSMFTFYKFDQLRIELYQRFFSSSNVDFVSAYELIVEDERNNLKEIAYKIFNENPWFGIGIGNFNTYLNFNSKNLSYSNAHNLYLNLLAETGVFGLGLFILFIGCLINRNFKKKYLVAILFFLLYGFFSGEIYSEGFYFSFFPMYFLFYLKDAN